MNRKQKKIFNKIIDFTGIKDIENKGDRNSSIKELLVMVEEYANEKEKAP